MSLTFGQVVTKKRKELGLSQKRLASMIFKEDGLPISAQYLNDIERDRRNPPGDFLLNEIAKVLKVDEEVLYYLAGELPANIRRRSDDPEKITKAFHAFRKTLGGDK
jgi:transcriptional regulator with XRE-family HTH domain